MEKKDYEKKSFIFYMNWMKTFDNLTDDEAGRLIKHLLRYVNGIDLEPQDRLTQLISEPFKQIINSDLKKYENIIERNRINGKKGGRPSGKNPKKPSGLLNNPKKPDTDTDTGTDTGTALKKENNNINNYDVEEIYKAYPTKCVTKGSLTYKSSKNKKQIEELLKTISKDDLIKTIEKYVEDCRKHKLFMKNFSTFLNNPPDYPDEVKTENWRGEKKEIIGWQQ